VPSHLIVVGNDGGELLATIAAVLETVHGGELGAPDVDWWRRRRGAAEAQIRVRWALSASEAAIAGIVRRTAVSEWRFGLVDDLPREIQVPGMLPQTARAALHRYLYLDPTTISMWMEADPLAQALAGIVRQDVAATRVCCREGVGIVRTHTPNTLAVFSRAIARIFPAIRIERAACPPGETPVICHRNGKRVELDQLDGAERDALFIAVTIHTAKLRDGVVLVDRADLHVSREARARWLEWLAGLAPTNQLFVTASEAGGLGA
jgi:hypothetical protein